MRNMKRALAAGAGLALALSMVACSGSADGDAGNDAGGETVKLSMGVVPTDEMSETFNQWGYLIERLSEETGYEIELFEATDLAAVIEATIAGDLDIIHLGPFGHLIAHQNGAEISTVGATAPTSAGTNNAAVALVREDSRFDDLEDLEGEDVCFISPSSTTGYLFGAAAFQQLGIDPETDLNPIFIGDHASAVRTMYDGECAAVFTYRDYAERVVFEDNPDIDSKSVRVIWKETVPEAGLAVSTTLPQDVQDTLRSAMLELNGTNELEAGSCPDERVVEPEDGSGTFCGIWPNLGWGLEEHDDTYWEPVEVVCRETNAPACAS